METPFVYVQGFAPKKDVDKTTTYKEDRAEKQFCTYYLVSASVCHLLLLWVLYLRFV